MHKNAIPTAEPVKVSFLDWRKIPADVKSLVGGTPRIRTHRGKQVVLAPVQIVRFGLFGL